LRLAFIVEFLAARQGDLELALFVEIELERHALDGADQFIDLPPMQQQLSRPLRCELVFVALAVKRPS